MKEITRIMEDPIEDLLHDLPAIAIDGPKAVGKTWLARRMAGAIFEFDKEEIRALYRANRELITTADSPVLIDEWQKAPDAWDIVRRAVDEDASPGRFLLTGSAYPKDANVHSGAGRIAHVRLYPLSLAERSDEGPAVSIGRCIQGKQGKKIFGETAKTLEYYIKEILGSGFPGILGASARARPRLIEGYIENIISRETYESGFSVRKPASLLSWMRAFASATATDAGYGEILDSATAGERNKPSKSATSHYRDMLTNLWLLEELHPWLPLEGNFNRLKMTPKHYLADPAIEASLLGIDFDLVMSAGIGTKFDNRYGSITGRLFESLVGLSLRTYAAASGAKLNFIKTLDGAHEVDFIVSRGPKAVAIEGKMSDTADDHDVRHLNWLGKSYGKNLMAKIIVTTGRYAYRREQDDVIVCPAALLGP